MASILRQIVSGPRARHPEAGLDLCYVADNIVVTSGPSSVWPKKAYRNPIDQLVGFLDKKHGEEWAIFEFRAEGTGYPDEEVYPPKSLAYAVLIEQVYGRIHHFPWPDHHPPPFAIIPNLMAAMRNWLQQEPKDETKRRVAVVHCQAGKGRSGTVATSYLISQEGWRMEDALKRFTSRRMRSGFGEGVSIPSQLRWVRYVNTWTNKLDKKYLERPVEIVEIHVVGLRGGVKVCVEGFIEEGRRIKNFHTFTREEKIRVDDQFKRMPTGDPPSKQNTETLIEPATGTPMSSRSDLAAKEEENAQNVILRPSRPILLETSDINIDFERRNKSAYTGFAMVTSIAHVWFNVYFEGGAEGNDSGLFEIDWEAMDGIKGSARKGIKALDKLKVVWKYSLAHSESVDEPKLGEPVKEGKPADWRGDGNPEKDIESKSSEGLGSGHGGAALTLSEMTHEAIEKLKGRDLGLRPTDAGSTNISRASTIREEARKAEAADPKVVDESTADSDNELHGVQSHVQHTADAHKEINVNESHEDDRQDTAIGKYLEAGIAKLSGILAKDKPNDK